MTLLSNSDQISLLLRQALRHLEPFHPTDAFDMIVGTSTGGLIALGSFHFQADGLSKIQTYDKLTDQRMNTIL